MKHSFEGVLPTATGSEVHRLSTERGEPINNGNMEELLSDKGIEYIRRVIANSVESGATIGVTSTFRVTPYRAADTGWDFHDMDTFTLTDEYARWNEQLVSISREAYGDKLLLGNVAPTTNTSAGVDDERFASVGGGSSEARIEFARQRQDAQISFLAQQGVDGILVEAGRHPDDMLGIARSVRERAISLLAVSFEAEEAGIPDVIRKRDGYNFADMKADLQKEAGDTVDVRIGVNCVGSTLVQSLLEAREKLDIVYPNQTDPGRFTPLPASVIKDLRTLINESGEAEIKEFLAHHLNEYSSGSQSIGVRALRHTLEHAENFVHFTKEALNTHGESTPDELRNVWKLALKSGAQVVGICCGGRPEHVEEARREYDVHRIIHM